MRPGQLRDRAATTSPPTPARASPRMRSPASSATPPARSPTPSTASPNSVTPSSPATTPAATSPPADHGPFRHGQARHTRRRLALAVRHAPAHSPRPATNMPGDGAVVPRPPAQRPAIMTAAGASRGADRTPAETTGGTRPETRTGPGRLSREPASFACPGGVAAPAVLEVAAAKKVSVQPAVRPAHGSATPGTAVARPDAPSRPDPLRAAVPLPGAVQADPADYGAKQQRWHDGDVRHVGPPAAAIKGGLSMAATMTAVCG
jgi:hypothetical protein